jgi:hypothetical protein
MPKTPARITQADIARAARVAKGLGDEWTVEIAPDGTIRLVQRQGLDVNWRSLEDKQKRPVL